MHSTFTAIAAALDSFSSRDDIATGLAGIAMCAVSVTMFVAMFSGAL